jgi:hypothetical protein
MRTLVKCAHAVVLVALVAMPAGAAVLCKKRSGAVLARDACRKKETPADTAERPVVRDANGALVGPLLGASGTGTVLRRVGDVLMTLTVDTTGFVDTFPSFDYESTNCSGPPLVPAPAAMLTIAPIVRGGTAYYASGTPAAHTIQSTLTGSIVPGMCFSGTFVPPDACCLTLPSPQTMQVTPAATVPLGTLGLVPPFRVTGP